MRFGTFTIPDELIAIAGGTIIGYLITNASKPQQSYFGQQQQQYRSYVTSGSINYLGAAPPITSFAAVGDFGDTADTQKVMDAIRTYPMILLLGDNAYDKGDINKVDAWYNKYLANYGGQRYATLGNEDNKSGSIADKYRTLLGVPSWNYSFDSGAVHFLCLNTEALASSTDIYADLRAAKARGMPWIIVFLHKPCKTPPAKHVAENTWLCNAFEKTGVDMVLQGHNHFYVRYAGKLNATGNNTYYFVSGLGGRDKYSTKSRTGIKKYINNAFGYMKITVNPDGLSTKFISAAGVILDSFTVKKLVAPVPVPAPTPEPVLIS